MIAIVDTGGANLASVSHALTRLGKESVFTRDHAVIQSSSHVILPGVGAAADTMRRVNEHGLGDLLRSLTQPVLGICLGMQLLFESSDEGATRCLGILPGVVRVLEPDIARGITIPHMGWNTTRSEGTASTLFAELEAAYYFVHSYCAPTGPWVRWVTDHGGPVVAAIEHHNFFGVQFHPERSGHAGAALLDRFVNL